jgi:hypothetical protein
LHSKGNDDDSDDDSIAKKKKKSATTSTGGEETKSGENDGGVSSSDDDEDNGSGENSWNVNNLSEEEVFSEYARYQKLLAKRQGKKFKGDGKGGAKPKQKMAFEIDFDYFTKNFWGTIAKQYAKKVASPSIVWSEIQSNIKGSAEAVTSMYGFVGKDVYTTSHRKSTLSSETK